MLRTAPPDNRELVIPSDDNDLEANVALSEETRGRLKSQRRMLRKMITDEHFKALNRIKLMDQLLECTARVLNPGAHAGDPPLFENEILDALDIIRQLEVTVANP